MTPENFTLAAAETPRILLIGLGATLVLDTWLAALRLAGRPTMNFALLGRWVGHGLRGRWRHAAIARVEPVRGELALGWVAHYAVGVVFAFLLVVACGADWLQAPRLAPAFAFGLLTVAAPFLVMQPAMGQGLAAARTPTPQANRLRSLTNHAVFGVGLYLAARLVASVPQ